MKNIGVFGCGYVGIATGSLLSEKNKIIFFEIDDSRIEKLKKLESTVDEEGITERLIKNSKNIIINNGEINLDYAFICLPTNYNDKLNSFDLKVIDIQVEKILKENIGVKIVIKSTIPVGYTDKLRERHNYDNIHFCPEFLRESKALNDSLYPSRIIIGGPTDSALDIYKIYSDCIDKKDVTIIYTGNKEAESIKLFSNTYLASRVAFFNEVDNYCLQNKLNTNNVIDGISLDERIGSHYNNPSFGYGGYCLPKDTKQTKSMFIDADDCKLITNIEISNNNRIKKIAKEINALQYDNIGFFRLIMKSNSDNCRDSSSFNVLIELNKVTTKKIYVYEPSIPESDLLNSKNIKLIKDKDEFFDKCDIFVSNRIEDELKDKLVFTRDIYNNN